MPCTLTRRALRCARLPVNLIGFPINYANRLIGYPITSQSAALTRRAGAAQMAQEWPDLQAAVSSLCMLWWQKELPGREQLVAQLTVYLCARALTSGQAPDPRPYAWAP